MVIRKNFYSIFGITFIDMCSTCCMERTLNKCRNILKMIWVIRLCIQFIFYAACYYVIYQNISAEIAGCFIAILSLRQHSWRPYRSCLFVLNNESHTVNSLNFWKYFWYVYTRQFIFNDSIFLIRTCRITDIFIHRKMHKWRRYLWILKGKKYLNVNIY